MKRVTWRHRNSKADHGHMPFSVPRQNFSFGKPGFTLIEVLIVISIVVILASILIPMLIAPRAEAFNTATQTCLKELSARQHAAASESPFEFNASLDPTSVTACEEIDFDVQDVQPDEFTYVAKHPSGSRTYQISTGTGVTGL